MAMMVMAMRVAVARVARLAGAVLLGFVRVTMVMAIRVRMTVVVTAVIVRLRRSGGLLRISARTLALAMNCAGIGLAVSGTHRLQNGTVWASAQVPKREAWSECGIRGSRYAFSSSCP